MKKIADSLILFTISSILAVVLCSSQQAVMVILTVLAITTIILYADNKKIWIACLFIYIILCVSYPYFFIFIPVLLYHSLWYKTYISYFLIFIAVPFLDYMDYQYWLIILCELFLSLFLAYYSRYLAEVENKLIVLRDTSKERDILLREKNKELMDRQDYEVYLATLKERNRIAREIHDNVGHMITRSILQIGALKAVYKEEVLYRQLEGVNDTLNQAMTSIRQSVHNLYDDAIDLKKAIDEVTKEISKYYKLNFDYDMSKEVPKQVKYCFIATVKEAVSNIVKHSNGDTVTLIMREHPGFYQISISDNGNQKNDNEPGIGLINMRERVEKIGGTIHFKNGDGFQIFITVKK